MNQLRFAVIGGDQRQSYLYKLLGEQGFPVTACGVPGIECEDEEMKAVVAGSDVVILPLPVTQDGRTVNAPFAKTPIYLSDVFNSSVTDQLFLGGKVNKKLQASLRDRSITLIDYFQREELSILNAIPTAEGAIAIAMDETNRTIYGSRILVTGFGRLSKLLAPRLAALGADLHIAARKQADLAFIEAYGYTPHHFNTLKNIAGGFDILINTVPAMVFPAEVISKLREDAVLIDLASAPGGVDFEAAWKKGVTAVQALSLPGKVAPYSAAQIILSTIFNIIKEEKT